MGSVPVRPSLCVEPEGGLFFPIRMRLFRWNLFVSLDCNRSHVAAVRAPVHCSSVSSHPESNILRMAFRAEPLCYGWVDQEAVPSVMFPRTASFVDERKGGVRMAAVSI